MDRQKMWWQNALEKRVSGRQMCRILGIIFVLTSIPLFVVGLFNAPAIDDFYYSVQTMPVFRQTSSVIQTIAAAFAQVADTYLNWQGSYAAVFLFALHPAVFGEAWYAMHISFAWQSPCGKLAVFVGPFLPCIESRSYLLAGCDLDYAAFGYPPGPVSRAVLLLVERLDLLHVFLFAFVGLLFACVSRTQCFQKKTSGFICWVRLSWRSCWAAAIW